MRSPNKAHAHTRRPVAGWSPRRPGLRLAFAGEGGRFHCMRQARMILHTETSAASTTGRCIKAGDLVIVYERFDSMKSVYVNPAESYGSRYGNFKLKVAWWLRCRNESSGARPLTFSPRAYRTGLGSHLGAAFNLLGAALQAGCIYWHQHQNCGPLFYGTGRKFCTWQTSV